MNRSESSRLGKATHLELPMNYRTGSLYNLAPRNRVRRRCPARGDNRLA
jgi:hypothetical protein